MARRLALLICLMRFALLVSPGVGDDTLPSWGTISGQFILEGAVDVPPLVKQSDEKVTDKLCSGEDIPDESLVVNPENHGIANIFVYLKTAPASIHPDLVQVPDRVELTTEKCRFVPHCQVLRVGQVLTVRNRDATAHNAHFFTVSDTVACGILGPDDDIGQEVRFERAESLPVRTTCDFHAWMDSYIAVLDHPYAAVTDADGKFRIEKLPAGEHTFTVWHERCGYLNKSFHITVTGNQVVTRAPEKVLAEKLRKGK